jgi:hypothetical protein
LTNGLVSVHKLINHPEFQNLKLMEKMDYELKSWHNEIISVGLGARRGVAKAMNSLEEILEGLETRNL